MKKILSLLALAMLCVTGANAEKVIYSWPGGDQANSITLAEGVTVQITGNTSKNIQSANKITVNGTEYTSMKVSNGAQNTLTLPKEAIGITFYSYINKASDAEGLRDTYWKEVAGVNYDAETSGGLMSCYSDGDKTNPDVRSFSFEATKEITFTNTGEQVCYVMEVEYAVPSKAVFLIPNAWDAADATERYAAYVWAGEDDAKVEKWFDFQEYNGVYAAAVPTGVGFTGIILVRMDGETTENNWDNKWNQTADINFADLADNTVFTMTSIDGDYTTTPFSDLITEAQEYMAIFNKDAASALNPLIADLAAELAKEVKDFDAIKAKIKTLVTAASPVIAAGIEKVEGYAADINDETLNADIAAIKAAYAANDFAKLIANMKTYEKNFVGVATNYLGKAKAIDTTGKLGADKLERAIAAVEAQLNATSIDIMQLGLAVRNLVVAMREFEELNTTYTVAGNLEAIFGTAWDPTNTANDMTKGADGIWTKVYENVPLEASTILYKVVKNHSWDESYGFDGENATYEIKSAGTAETITFTFDPNAEGNKVSCTVKMADSDLMAQARALAAEDGVAVGKLLQAIEYAEAGDETGLQAAIDQYKEDNKDQEKDETAKVATNGWKKYDGTAAGVCATQFAPAITTYDGRTAQLAEVFENNGNRTGTIIYQDITGLTNGKYKVGFYGNAFSTSVRDGFECTMEEGADDVAYVFANDQKAYITAHIATFTTENDFRQFDVEVTDGAIKLGMGKDTEKSTNWHTMQIYQLTWFTTAKEVFAADQEELKALLAEANALLADEYKTEGKEGFEFFVRAAEQAVDSKMINIAELENVIGNLKTAIADFEKLNWYIDLAAGEYYVIDAETDLKMAAGHNYGTRGIVNEMGLDLTLTPYTESRTVTFDSRVSNGGDNHFLGQNLYMDSSSWGWALEYRGFGFYILDPNTQKYINIDSENNLVLSDTPREFIIVTKEGVVAERMEELEAATVENPVDATFLLQNPNFNRNDQRVSAWVVTFTEGDNSNLNGGNQVNNCGESYHAAFTVKQTVEGAPKGMYELTAQGFYRQDTYEGEEAPAAPVFFANGVNKDVPARTGTEDSMSAASESFTNGLYTIEPIKFDVTDEGENSGKIYVGVTTAVTNQWVIFDNFRLLYYGKDSSTTGISELTANGQNAAAAEGIYNLQGQRVEKAKKGLYIINGKKMVVK